MKKKASILLLLSAVTFSGLHAQKVVYDPLLDPKAKVLPDAPREEWSSTYMWYPGQLAAYYQQQHRESSKERCVNVGYPGNFFAMNNHVYFKKDVRLKEATELQWAGPSIIMLYVNGEKQATSDNKFRLPAGQLSLLFEVVAGKHVYLAPCTVLGNTSRDLPQRTLRQFV